MSGPTASGGVLRGDSRRLVARNAGVYLGGPSVDSACDVVDVGESLADELLSGVDASGPMMTDEYELRLLREVGHPLVLGLVQEDRPRNSGFFKLAGRSNIDEFELFAPVDQ